MNKILIFTILFIIISCSNKTPVKNNNISDNISEKNYKISVDFIDTTTNNKPQKIENNEFGPIFIAKNNFLNVSLYYRSSYIENTHIHFTMTGDIDWLRIEKNDDYLHRMDFDDLEEEAVYNFNIKTKSKNIITNSSIMTMPYGTNYNFNFAIVDISKNIEIKDNLHFLILTSSNIDIPEDAFVRFINSNKVILANTIIYPLFNVRFNNKKINNFVDNIREINYKNVYIYYIPQNYNNVHQLVNLLPDNPNKKNYIIYTGTNLGFIDNLILKAGNKIYKIYTLNNLKVSYVSYIDNRFYERINNKSGIVMNRF